MTDSSSELLNAEEAESLLLLLWGVTSSYELKELYAVRMFTLGHDPKSQVVVLEGLAQKFLRLMPYPHSVELLVSHHSGIEP